MATLTGATGGLPGDAGSSLREPTPDEGEGLFEPAWSLEPMPVDSLDSPGKVWADQLVSPFAGEAAAQAADAANETRFDDEYRRQSQLDDRETGDVKVAVTSSPSPSESATGYEQLDGVDLCEDEEEANETVSAEAGLFEETPASEHPLAVFSLPRLAFLSEEYESPTDELEEFETASYGEESSMLDSLLEFETEADPGLASRLRGMAAFALGPALQRGSSGAAVAALQRALTSLGHPLKDDGDFGPKTEAAVRAFQVRRGLSADGVVDAPTKAVIATALAVRGQPPAPSPASIVGPAPQPAAQAHCASVVAVAEGEYRRWRPGGAALSETDAAATPILQDYYRTGVGVEVTAQQLQSGMYQNNHPWSAVFISWVMRTAGINTFPVSRAHQTYIRAARRARLDGNAAMPYWAYRTNEIAPQVGDLVCKARAGSGATYDNIGDAVVRPTHCDVVTAVRPGSIRTVGGNVNQRVDARSLRTQADGRLDVSGDQALFFAVMRCRTGGAA